MRCRYGKAHLASLSLGDDRLPAHLEVTAYVDLQQDTGCKPPPKNGESHAARPGQHSPKYALPRLPGKPTQQALATSSKQGQDNSKMFRYSLIHKLRIQHNAVSVYRQLTSSPYSNPSAQIWRPQTLWRLLLLTLWMTACLLKFSLIHIEW